MDYDVEDIYSRIRALQSANLSTVPADKRKRILMLLTDVKGVLEKLIIENRVATEKASTLEGLNSELSGQNADHVLLIASLDARVKELEGKNDKKPEEQKPVVIEQVVINTEENSTQQ